MHLSVTMIQQVDKKTLQRQNRNPYRKRWRPTNVPMHFISLQHCSEGKRTPFLCSLPTISHCFCRSDILRFTWLYTAKCKSSPPAYKTLAPILHTHTHYPKYRTALHIAQNIAHTHTAQNIAQHWTLHISAEEPLNYPLDDYYQWRKLKCLECFPRPISLPLLPIRCHYSYKQWKGMPQII